MEFKTPLAQAQGLGSAKAGSVHWWMQRVTAFALIPLSYWLIKLLSLMTQAPMTETVVWISAPLNTVCIVSWIVAVFYHAALGIQVVLEDYVSTAWLKITGVWILNLFFTLLAFAALIAIFRILFTG